MGLLKLIGHIIIIIFLTALTQVGGIIWLITLLKSVKFRKRKRYIFPILYLLCNLLIVPRIAKQYGRESLPTFNKTLKPRNWIYPLLFRNYATSKLKIELEDTAHILYKSGISITYLDANFPFLDGFPLLPHLSHNDGKKVDISFMYLDKNEKITNKKPSVSGYGVYVQPNNSISKTCIKKGYWQYDFPKYLTFGTINDLELDNKRTKNLIRQLLTTSNADKIFIEPYLKEDLGLSSENKIRFHGCQAVRHDDHIHFQIK